jgi:CubicO group peptidase (beta-lactamase class C family)
MIIVNRREFSRMALALAATAPAVRASKSASNHIDDTLRVGMERRKIPAITAMVATPDKITYQGAFGTRDADSGVKITMDSIFAIASMTKAITSTAALQLVDQGKLKLDEPVAKHIPEFAKLQVLDGYDSSGKPILRPVRVPVTLKHLLTHTSGFCYDFFSDEMVKYEKASGRSVAGVAPLVPLMFEPGTRWHYGYSTDWAGRLVETVSGLTLEDYFRRNIFDPLGMNDTTFLLPAAKYDRLVTGYNHQPDGSFKPASRKMPAAPKAFSGGGGLYSTAGDYVKFTQMILRRGRSEGSVPILQAKTVALMTSNQIGALSAGKLKTQSPELSSDVDVHPGAVDKWGLGFLINTVAYPGGRAAGSLAWAGIDNTFYWIDPKRQLCAVLMMQFLPFVDKDAVGMLGEFEKAVYAA